MTVNKGNPDAAFSQATKKYEATYHWPFQLHGMLGTIVRGGGCARGFGDGLVWNARAVPHQESAVGPAAHPGKEHPRDLSGGVGVLRAAEPGRRATRCRASFARGGQAGSRAVDARRRAWLGAERAGTIYQRARRSGCAGQSRGLGLYGTRLSVDRVGGKSVAGGAANRDEKRESGPRQWKRGRRGGVRIRESAGRRGADSVVAGSANAVAHKQSARAGRSGAHVCERIITGRDCRGPARRSGAIPASLPEE